MFNIDTSNRKLTIEDIYRAIKESIKRGGCVVRVSKQFASLENDEGRIVFIDKLFKKYSVTVPFETSCKDDNKSQEKRIQGNQICKQKKNAWALHIYNESIALASEGSESIALAYGNRSAILLRLKNYTSCLEDIERAKSGYPSESWPKLILRRTRCEELLNNNPAPAQITRDQPRELLRGPNAQFPCASAALTLRYTEDWGRHVTAKRNIRPGDVLAIEPAYCTALIYSHRYRRCTNCMGKSLTLIPCTNCSNAMFCGEMCLKEAMEKYHGIECKLGASLKALNLCNLQLMSFRTAIRALSDYNCDIEALRAATEDIEKREKRNKQTAGFIKSSGGRMIYDSDAYAPIHCLITNSAKRTPGDLFYCSVVANCLLLLVRTHTAIGRSFNEDNASFFGSLILRHLQSCTCNVHTISALEFSKTFDGDIEIGNGAYAFHSLLNHSCSPNITTYSTTLNRRRVMATVAILPIKSGEQIFKNYGFHYGSSNLSERRRALYHQYFFQCKCVACQAYYPLYHNLPHIIGVPRSIVTEDHRNRLIKMDKEVAAQKINDYMNLLAELGKSQPFPNSQVCDLQETVKQCLAILAMDSY